MQYVYVHVMYVCVNVCWVCGFLGLSVRLSSVITALSVCSIVLCMHAIFGAFVASLALHCDCLHVSTRVCMYVCWNGCFSALNAVVCSMLMYYSCMHAHECMHECTYACICVPIYELFGCMYVYMCAYTYICICMHIHAHVHIAIPNILQAHD